MVGKSGRPGCARRSRCRARAVPAADIGRGRQPARRNYDLVCGDHVARDGPPQRNESDRLSTLRRALEQARRHRGCWECRCRPSISSAARLGIASANIPHRYERPSGMTRGALCAPHDADRARTALIGLVFELGEPRIDRLGERDHQQRVDVGRGFDANSVRPRAPAPERDSPTRPSGDALAVESRETPRPTTRAAQEGTE